MYNTKKGRDKVNKPLPLVSLLQLKSHVFVQENENATHARKMLRDQEDNHVVINPVN